MVILSDIDKFRSLLSSHRAGPISIGELMRLVANPQRGEVEVSCYIGSNNLILTFYGQIDPAKPFELSSIIYNDYIFTNDEDNYSVQDFYDILEGILHSQTSISSSLGSKYLQVTCLTGKKYFSEPSGGFFGH